MDELLVSGLPVAVVTGPMGGARVVPVVELPDGALVDRRSGVEIEMRDLVAVYGLPELGQTAA